MCSGCSLAGGGIEGLSSIVICVTLKRTGTDVRHLGSLRLWRDDLAEMVDIIREHEQDVSMSIKDWTLDDVDDLAKLPAGVKPDDFVLETKSERIRLTLSTSRAAIEINGTDPATRGVAAEIQRIASTKLRPAYRHRYAIRGTFLLMACGGVIGAFTNSESDKSANGEPSVHLTAAGWISLAFFAVGVLGFFLVVSNPSSPSGALINIQTKAEAPPWLRRNRDALVTNVIVSAIFLVLGIAVGYLLPR